MSKDTESLREILGDAIKRAEAESPLLDVDLKNLRFYATQFREHQWQSPWIHWSVFMQTLNEIADRTEELERRFREEFAMRDRYKAQSNSWRDRALRQASLLAEIAALDDGDEQFAWKHEDLFNRVHAEIEGSEPQACKIPPAGWYCTRAAGHDGPCAAVPQADPVVKQSLTTQADPVREEREKDSERLDWLNEQVIDVIYLDDGRIIDVRGDSIRIAIDAAREKPSEEKP
jgi:hypothetical protein